MAKLCIALGLCAAAAFFSLSQFASRRGRDDDEKALCSWLTRAGVPDRVRHWAQTSPLLQCAENLREKQEEEVKTLVSSFPEKEQDLYTTASSASNKSPYEPSYQEYDDLTPPYGTQAPEQLEEYHTRWGRKTASPESRTSAKFEQDTLKSSWSRILASSQGQQKATYHSRLGKTPQYKEEMLTTREPLFRSDQHGDVHVAQSPETVPSSSSDQLAKVTKISVSNTNLETLHTPSAKKKSKPLYERIRQRKHQATSASPSPTRAVNDSEPHSTNPALLAASVAPVNLEEKAIVPGKLPGIPARRPYEVPVTSTMLVSATQTREKQQASESPSASSSTIFHEHATETIYFTATYAPESKKKVSSVSETLPHLEEHRIEQTTASSLSRSPFTASKNGYETIADNFSNGDPESQKHHAETSTSSIPYLLDKDEHEGPPTSAAVLSVAQEIKQTATLDTVSELDLTASYEKEGSTAGSHSVPYTAGSEQDIGTSRALVQSSVENLGEATKTTSAELLPEQTSEETLISASLSKVSITWQDKDHPARKTAAHSSVEDNVEKTLTSTSDLLPERREEKISTSAPLSESPISRQHQDSIPTTTTAQSTLEVRAQATTSIESDPTLHGVEETLTSTRIPTSAASWQDVDTTPRTRTSQAAVQDGFEEATSTELYLQSEQKAKTKSISAPVSDSSTLGQEQHVTLRTTAAQSSLADHIEATTSTESALVSKQRAEKTTSLSESSTSWKDQETALRSADTPATIQDGAQAVASTEFDFQLKQQAQKSPSAPEPEPSDSLQYQDITAGIAAAHSTLEDDVEATTSTKSELESEQLAERTVGSAPLPEPSTSWQDQDTEPRTGTTHSTVEDSVEETTGTKPKLESEQLAETTVSSAPLPESYTSWQDQDTKPRTGTSQSAIEDSVEATTSTKPKLESEQLAENTVGSASLSEPSTSGQDQDTEPRTGTIQSTVEDSVEATTSTKPKLEPEQLAEKTMGSAPLPEPSTSGQDQDTEPRTGTIQSTVEDSDEITTSTKLKLESEQLAETTVSSAPLPEPYTSWQDQDTKPRTGTTQSAIEDSVEATTNAKPELESEQLAEKTLDFAPLPEPSTSEQDQDTEPRTGTTQATFEDSVEATTSTKPELESEQGEEKTVGSAPFPEPSTSGQDQDTEPRTGTTQATFEDSVEAATSTKSELESEQVAEKTVSSAQLPEPSNSWQDQDTEPRTDTTQSTVEDSAEANTSTKPKLKSEQLAERTVGSAPLPEPSTSWQDQDTEPRTDTTHSTVEDSVEETTGTKPKLESEQLAETTVSSAPLPESYTSWQDQDTNPRTGTSQSAIEDSVEATTSTKPKLESEQLAEKTVGSASLYEPSTSGQDQNTEPRTGTIQSIVEDSVEATTSTKPKLEPEQLAEKTMGSAPLPEPSTSGQDQDTEPWTGTIQSTVEDSDEITTSTKLKLESEQLAETTVSSAPLPEPYTSWQDQDTKPRTGTPQSAIEDSAEATTNAKPELESEQLAEKTLDSAPLPEPSTSEQDQDTEPRTGTTQATFEDSVEATTNAKPELESEQGEKKTVNSAPLPEPSTSWQDEDTEPRTGTTPSILEGSVEATTSTKPELESEQGEEKTVGSAPFPEPSTSRQDQDTEPRTGTTQATFEDSVEATTNAKPELESEQGEKKTVNSAPLPEPSTSWQDQDTEPRTGTTPSILEGSVEATTSIKPELESEQGEENTVNSAPLPEPATSWQDQDTEPRTGTTQATFEDSDEATTSNKSELQSEQEEEKTVNSAPLPEPSTSWQDQDTEPRTGTTQSILEDSVEATISNKSELESEQGEEKTVGSAQLPEPSTLGQDQDTEPRTGTTQATFEDSVEATTNAKPELESEQVEEKTVDSAPLPEPSTSWQDQDTEPRTGTTPSILEGSVEATTSTKPELESEQGEEKTVNSAPLPEPSTSWQDQDTEPRTGTTQATFEDSGEATTSNKSELESEQEEEKTVNSAQLPEPSTSWQDQDTEPRTGTTQATFEDSDEATTSNKSELESEQEEEKTLNSAPLPEHSISWQDQDSEPRTGTTQSILGDSVEATTNAKPKLESEQREEKTVNSAPLSEPSTSWQDQDTEPLTGTAQSTVEVSVETTTSTKSDFLSQSEAAVTMAQLTSSTASYQAQDTTPSAAVSASSVEARVELTTTIEPAIEEPDGPKIVCYFTSWSIYRDDRGRFAPEDIDPKVCTHIMYAFATLDSATLLISMADPWADEDMELYKRVTSLKAANRRLKVLLSLGGAVDSDGPDKKYSRLAANATARRNFARHAASFLLKHRFDGLDVDWEFPNCEYGVCPSNPPDKENFVLLLKDLREVFAEYSRPLLLTAALSGSIEVIEEAYQVPEIFKHLDFASLMAYDYYGAWSTVIGHYAPLQSAVDETNPELSIEYVVRTLLAMGAPASQLVLGVPFYATSFTLANPRLNEIGSPSKGAGKPGPVTDSPGVLSYYEICSAIKAGGWSTMMDPRAGVYAFSGDQWVCFDGPRSLTRKARFAQKVGLAGLMVWDLSMDDFRGECGRIRPLLSAVRRALYPPPATPAGRG
ncbi:uncharacterized protein LOC144101001 [Amblyomma americanum]